MLCYSIVYYSIVYAVQVLPGDHDVPVERLEDNDNDTYKVNNGSSIIIIIIISSSSSSSSSDGNASNNSTHTSRPTVHRSADRSKPWRTPTWPFR